LKIIILIKVMIHRKIRPWKKAPEDIRIRSGWKPIWIDIFTTISIITLVNEQSNSTATACLIYPLLGMQLNNSTALNNPHKILLRL